MPNALVLVFDRLGSGYLGPYGNTWIETPAWNLLASRSMLAETAVSDSVDLPSLYHSFWQGRHALSQRHTVDVPPLSRHLADHHVNSYLVTDEQSVAEHPCAESFTERLVLPGGEEREAEDIEQSQLARLFATVVDVLEQARPPFLLWVHARAMQGPWDAPYDLRYHFAEEEDPDPPRTARPPDLWLAEDYDPDELLGFQHAYAGQVSLLDTCLGILLDALWSGPHAQDTGLLATATRGYPLGEHHYVGTSVPLLHGEVLQVPWLFHAPTGEGAAWRAHQILQPPDIFPSLLEWLDVPLPPPPLWGRSALPRHLEAESRTAREQAVSVNGSHLAIRVPAWFLCHDDAGQPHLYAKPDDRWEGNEVANRCQEVVEQLTEVQRAFQSAAQQDAREQLGALGDELGASV